MNSSVLYSLLNSTRSSLELTPRKSWDSLSHMLFPTVQGTVASKMHIAAFAFVSPTEDVPTMLFEPLSCWKNLLTTFRKLCCRYNKLASSKKMQWTCLPSQEVLVNFPVATMRSSNDTTMPHSMLSFRRSPSPSLAMGKTDNPIRSKVATFAENSSRVATMKTTFLLQPAMFSK